jgi:protein PhnA
MAAEITTEKALIKRSESKCELCSATTPLSIFDVPPSTNGSPENTIFICATCTDQLNQSAELEANHWRCLNDSMWSPVPVVQVVAWRQLKLLVGAGEAWAQDLLDMLYHDETLQTWAEAGLPETDDSEPTLDSNGAVLKAGDTVTLIKDLEVKGANFTAKRGTAVRNIGLTSNPEHIEGRVNGTRIVLLTCYLKKSN